MDKVLRVGIAGLGTVGASVARLLHAQAKDLAARTGRSISVTGVSARDPGRDRGVDLSGAAFFADPVALAACENIDLFVELIGGEEGPARQSVTAALEAGKSVVTANKALLAKHGLELARLAEKNRAALAFEASVAGGIPIVKTLREGLAGNSIARVYGILNGTCNYILSRMELEGLSFAECLADAQKLGYAEADPTFDIGGFDTAHKLAILASLAFGVKLDAHNISIEGIEDISLADLKAAKELGFRVKLLGVAQRTAHGVEQRVHPTMVPLSSSIAQVMGVTNAVTVDADAVNELTLVGPGAGGMATASAVVADIADISRGIRSAPFDSRSITLRQRKNRRCSATRAAITSGSPPATTSARRRRSPSAWRIAEFHWKASCSAVPARTTAWCPWCWSPTPPRRPACVKRWRRSWRMATSRKSRRSSASSGSRGAAGCWFGDDGLSRRRDRCGCPARFRRAGRPRRGRRRNWSVPGGRGDPPAETSASSFPRAFPSRFECWLRASHPDLRAEPALKTGMTN